MIADLEVCRQKQVC